MEKILIIYATTDGHTKYIAERMAKIITDEGNETVIFNIEELAKFDPEPILVDCQKIVIGGSIRYGHHHKLITKLINAYQPIIDSKINAFFSVNVVARKPEKATPFTNPYLQKFLSKTSWKPKMLAVFAGRLEYPNYTTIDRAMIRLIMWMTNGPTARDTVIEYTKWEDVEKFALRVSKA